MLFRKEGSNLYTIREQSYGLATVANVWVGAFPLTIFIVYCFINADVDSFVSLGSGDDKEGGDESKNLEMTSLVDNDELAVIQAEPVEPNRNIDIGESPRN